MTLLIDQVKQHQNSLDQANQARDESLQEMEQENQCLRA